MTHAGTTFGRDDKLKEPLIKFGPVSELALSDANSIPRSGSALQPNVAARRLRWVEAQGVGRNPVGVEAD
jgi:hypothetical protein